MVNLEKLKLRNRVQLPVYPLEELGLPLHDVLYSNPHPQQVECIMQAIGVDLAKFPCAQKRHTAVQVQVLLPYSGAVAQQELIHLVEEVDYHVN